MYLRMYIRMCRCKSVRYEGWEQLAVITYNEKPVIRKINRWSNAPTPPHRHLSKPWHILTYMCMCTLYSTCTACTHAQECHICVHTYVHTYIRTYIRTYSTYVHTYILTYVHTYIRMYVCMCIHHHTCTICSLTSEEVGPYEEGLASWVEED